MYVTLGVNSGDKLPHLIAEMFMNLPLIVQLCCNYCSGLSLLLL